MENQVKGSAMFLNRSIFFIPGILSDEIDLPFQNVLDYSDFFYQVA
jgi:hypothetical protein